MYQAGERREHERRELVWSCSKYIMCIMCVAVCYPLLLHPSNQSIQQVCMHVQWMCKQHRDRNGKEMTSMPYEELFQP